MWSQQEGTMDIPRTWLSSLTRAEVERLRQECNFNDEELAVYNLRVRNKSNVQISFELGMSERTVDRRVKSIKHKISKIT